ncbi:MAG TPA: (S)-benzoin forming benzil reductase [Candidatus Angelobacter sp.]|nr:(S)-benzoin forming benzil reductase [Candidatus Angelobacter sp.]
MITYIITGVSKGLGESLARQVMKPDHLLICLSRRENQKLIDEAREAGCEIVYYTCDLSDQEAIIDVTNRLLKETSISQSERLVLINNAGIVEPIKKIGYAEAGDLAQNIQVNLIAPMILMNWFIQTFSDHPAQKQVANVSSGAGTNPYHGWAAYCSSKAGLDMFTRTIAIEQEHDPRPTEVMAFSPGVMDTEMQGQIRAADEDNFSKVSQFREYKEKGLLRTPELVASRLLDLLDKGFESGRVYSIQELL